MTRPDALLLVKPDGVASGLVPAFRSAVAMRGAAVVHEQTVEFGPGDVERLWPTTGSDEHPATVTLLDCFMRSGPSELLLLSGSRALEAAAAAKRGVRRRLGNRLFGSYAHSPDRPEEVDRETELLLAQPAARAAVQPPDDVVPRPGAKLEELGVDVDALRAECRIVWEEVATGRFSFFDEAVVRLGATHLVVLNDDDFNSVDTFIAGMLRVEPELDPCLALRLVVQLDITDAAPFVACSDADVNAVVDTLHKVGIPNVSVWPTATGTAKRVAPEADRA